MKGIALRAVRSAASGVLPWIPIALVTSPDLLGWALALSFGFSALMLGATLWVADPLKNLEIVDLGYFTIAGIAYLFSTPAFATDMSGWISEASTAVILLYSAGSLLVGHPFTAQYAAAYLPEATSRSTDFMRTNRILSALWVAIFAIQLACLMLSKHVLDRPDDVLMAWLIPIGSLIVGFVVNARVTHSLVIRETELAAQQARVDR